MNKNNMNNPTIQGFGTIRRVFLQLLGLPAVNSIETAMWHRAPRSDEARDCHGRLCLPWNDVPAGVTFQGAERVGATRLRPMRVSSKGRFDNLLYATFRFRYR